MSLNVKLEELGSCYKNQAFLASKSKSYSELIDLQSFKSDDLAYVVDCRKVEFEIFHQARPMGLSDNSSNLPIEEFFDHVHPDHQHAYVDLAAKLIKACQIDKELDISDFSYQIVYKNRQKRTLIRKAIPIVFGPNGTVEYTIGIINDVSDLLNSSSFRYQIKGSSKHRFYAHLNEIPEFSQVLTPRELQILAEVKNGLSSRQIGNKLFIAKNTVDRHRKNILQKLESKNSVEALNKAIEMGLLKF